VEVETLEVGTKMCVTVAEGVTVVTALAWQRAEGERRSWDKGKAAEDVEEGATDTAGLMLAWPSGFVPAQVAVACWG
jgi:hypothetical protein